jgi:regulator of sigma E protease
MGYLLSATFGSVMTTIGYVILAIVALMAMVVVHELGHYLAGKALGFKILEFNIGFGPPILKWRSKKTGELFAIRPIPLGGSCVFDEEDAAGRGLAPKSKHEKAESKEGEKSPTAFNSQKPWKRIIVLAAGAIFNFIAAFIIITFVFTFHGQVLPVVTNVEHNSANYGVLLEGDVFLRVDGKQVNLLELNVDYANFINTLRNVDGAVNVRVLRDGKAVDLVLQKYTVTNAAGEYEQIFGINTTIANSEGQAIFTRLPFFRALGRSFSFMFFLVFKILGIFGRLITGQLGLGAAGGPISAINVMQQSVGMGLGMLMYVVCLISANLAVMNLLPLPALDGSRIVFCTIEWIFKKPINKKIEAVIHFVGLILLFTLAIMLDIFHFLS